MSTLFCIFLGIVIGLSEFFPLSDAGHLSVLCTLFDINPNSGDGMFLSFLFSFAGIIILCIMFWGELSQMISDTAGRFTSGYVSEEERGRGFSGFRLLTLLSSSVAVYILAFVLVGNRVYALYNNTIYIGFMFLISGALLYVSDKFTPGKKKIRRMSYADALIIGIAAGAAVFPGLSRIGLVYCTGIALGLKKDFSCVYAYLLSLPVLLLNSISSLARAVNAGFSKENVPIYLLGTVFAVISGLVAVNLFRSLVQKEKMRGFAYYSWVAGLLFIILAVIF